SGRGRMARRKAASAGSPAELPLVDVKEKKAPRKDEEGGEAAYLPGGGPLTPEYAEFSGMVNSRVPTALRDLFTVREAATPTPLAEVQEALDLVRRHFRGAAMSHRALTRQSHPDLPA